jgi:hypothetical protein
LRLSPEDREFFALLSDIIFTNPFSVERAEIEALATPDAIPENRDKHLFGALIPALEERFARLERQGLTNPHPATARTGNGWLMPSCSTRPGPSPVRG